jgi:hypothetical protein
MRRLGRARLVAPLVGALALVALAACDVRELLLDSDLFPGTREAAALECCTCLLEEVAPVGGDRCTTSGDAGPPVLVDGGEARSPCLCDEHTPDSCATLLGGGGPILVVGLCVAEQGPCAAECDSVLAFPE